MARANVEAKYRCADHEGVRQRALALGAQTAGVLRQVDTFYRVSPGRLKLRDFGDGTGELISYVRADEASARRSDYRIYPTKSTAELAEVLAHALAVAGVVRKTRTLMLRRSTRIHLDEVEGLGRFVELETVVEGQSEAGAESEHRELARALGLRAEEIVPEAYVDLLRESA